MKNTPAETVKIGPIEYDIKRRGLIVMDHHEMLGTVDFPNSTIQLMDGMAPDPDRQVLWHEIVHAIMRQYDLDNLGEIEVEHLVECLAHGLKQLVEDNPWLAQRPR